MTDTTPVLDAPLATEGRKDTPSSLSLRSSLCSRFNFADATSTFSCQYIEPGIMSYLNTAEKDVVLLKKETIDRCIHTALQNGLTIRHVTPDGPIPKDEVVGRITAIRYNEADGWYWADGVIESDYARKLIKRGWKPSCAYAERAVRLNTAKETYHQFSYDKEITDLEFHHLAIVAAPRYEAAVFRLNHSNVSTTMNPFKLLKKIVTRENGADGKSVESTKVESRELPGDTMIEVDGKQVKLADAVSLHQRVNTAAPTLAEDEEVEIDGKMVLVKDVIATYRANSAAPAETPEQKIAREAKDAEKLAKRENGANAFKVLAQAKDNLVIADDEPKRPTSSGSLRDQVALGKARY